jgi:hypothetical protein
MPENAGQSSDIVEIAKRNGDFRRNYGMLLGAILYLRSLRAAGGRSFFWIGLVLALASILTFLDKLGWLRRWLPG